MNEFAQYNYRSQELLASWLIHLPVAEKKQYVPATIRPDWKMPESPVGKICPECGEKIEPIAHNTGDGWFLGWQCEGGICATDKLEDGMIDVWPFVEETANWRDLQDAGFTIV
mgnify:CR=1 FL=1